MSLVKNLLGLTDSEIKEEEIMERLEEAEKKGMKEVEFVRDNGERVVVRL